MPRIGGNRHPYRHPIKIELIPRTDMPDIRPRGLKRLIIFTRSRKKQSRFPIATETYILSTKVDYYDFAFVLYKANRPLTLYIDTLRGNY